MIEKRERWMQLAALAAEEQDPDKLMQLVREINSLLDDKMARLNRGRTGPTSSENVNPGEDQARKPASNKFP